MKKQQYKNSDYIIYEDGRCYSNKSNKFLTPQMSNKYPTYNLTIEGKKKKTYIHRMVAETFLQKQDENLNIVNHIDGDTHNFHLSNLEWVDASQNMKHAHANGLLPQGNQTINKYIGNLDNEDWVEINNYPLYVISSCGRVMNIKTKRLLKPALSNKGYYEVNLWKQGKGKTYQVHHLVYMNFTKDYDLRSMVINHIDGNKTNNYLSNLEKVSYRENNLHAVYNIKTNQCAKSVCQLDDNLKILKIFPSIAQAHRETGINNISRAIKTNRKAGGFYWKFNKDN